MKKFLALALALIAVLSFASCSKSEESEAEETTVVETTEAEAADDDEGTTEDEYADADIINVDGLKAIEETDTFDVVITKKEILMDSVGGISIGGNDQVVFTIKNNCGKEITDVSIAMVGYTDKNQAVSIKSGLATVGGDPNVTCYSFAEDITLEPGEEEEMAVQCDATDVAGIRAIVYSYTVDGEEIENPISSEWVKSVVVGQNTVLD